MATIFFDLETLPCNDLAIIAEFAADAQVEIAAVRAPSNYKDEVKIAEYISGKRAEIEAGIADRIAKTSFSGMYGRIACISWAVDDGEIQSTLATDSEEDAINRFYDAVREQAKNKHYGGEVSGMITLCGHNIAGFDLPFLKHRSMILGIRPPPDVLSAVNAKPWDKTIADTMLIWSQDREKRVSLDKLCRAFGIDGKGDFNGSMVAETWPVDPEKVIEYCKADIQKTRDVYRRLTWNKC